MNEFKRMQKLAGLITESKSKYSPSNFKLLKKDKDKEIYLLNNEDYTIPSGLEFNLKTIGNRFPDENENDFHYIQTDVYYNGKKLTTGSGIPGMQRYGGFDIAGSINKAKKWLDKNGNDFATGKKQYTIPGT
jgi:hypothetical protein